MHSLYRAIAVAAITFGASVVGMLLQWVLERFRDGRNV
jgi:hypothetical protein